MAIEEGIEIKGGDIIAKSSEKWTSVKVGCVNFFDSNRFLDGGLDKLSILLTFFPSLGSNGIKDELFKAKLTYTHREGQTFASFYKPPKLRTGDYFFSLKRSYPDFEEVIRTQAIVVKNEKANLKEITLLYLNNDVILLTDFFQNYMGNCNETYGINPHFSYST